MQNIVWAHPCQKQNPNELTKATVKFVVEKEEERHGWICLGCQMDYYQCKTHFRNFPLVSAAAALLSVVTCLGTVSVTWINILVMASSSIRFNIPNLQIQLVKRSWRWTGEVRKTCRANMWWINSIIKKLCVSCWTVYVSGNVCREAGGSWVLAAHARLLLITVTYHISPTYMISIYWSCLSFWQLKTLLRLAH